jgi:signal transduction histidine kinase
VSTRSKPVSTVGLQSDREADVLIAVSDDGPGISPKALEQIFLPFFTTKSEGTGLGLAISQRIVQGAGGRIDVRSRQGAGTTFTVVLPARMEALGTPTPGASRPSSEVILPATPPTPRDGG